MTLFDLVERERRGVARRLAAGGMGLVGAAVVVVLLATTLALGDSRWLTLPRVAPFVGWLLAVVAAVLGLRWLRQRLRHETSVTRIAFAVEEERALRAGSLRGALEVANAGVLGRLNATQVADRLSVPRSPTLAPALRRRALQRSALGGGAAVAGILALVTAASAAPDGWSALLHPLNAWNGSLAGGVTLGDAPRSVLRGDKVHLRVRAPGRRSVTLAQRVTGNSWRTSTLPITGDSGVVSLGPLDADLILYATDGRSTSDTLAVRVVDRPFIGDVTIRATFPGYLNRNAETLQLGERVRVPRGTVLDIDGHSSTELAGVRLAGAAGAVRFQVEGRGFRGQLTAATSATYTWTAQGVTSLIEDLPPPLHVDVLADSAPQVEILSPGRDSLVNARDTIGVSVLATDDHGLQAATLRIRITNASGEVRHSSVRPFGEVQGSQFQGQLALSLSALTPGDAMRIVATATDASPWRQVGASPELVLRFPSLREQRDAVRAAADSAVARAMATSNAQKQLHQRTADAARARQRDQQKDKDAMSYASAEQAKQLAREQRQLADRMEQMQRAAQDLEHQLKQAGALDSSLQERLREAQKLLRDALTPELQEKLRQLEQASQNMSQEDSRRAMQDLAEQQRKLREQLEKSVEMLKRAALEGQMQTLKDEAKDLAGKQRELVDSLRRADRDQQQADAGRVAQELSDRAKDLQEDVKRLQERLQQEKAEAGAERVQEANEKIDESLEKMQQAMQQQGEKTQQGEAGERGERQDGKQGEQKQRSGGEQGEKGGEKPQQKSNAQQQGQASKDGQQQSQNQSAAGQQAAQGGEQETNAGSAEQAAQAMEEAAQELSKAREQQVNEWKKELTGEMDRSIQEMLQLAREQDQLEQRARTGTQPGELRSQQSALQQGVDKTLQRLQQAGTKSNLLSQRSLRMMSDARRKVEEATAQTQRAQTGQQMASAMREASEALNQAGASLVRDRERTQQSESSTGFAEMLEQLQQMARQQQSLNAAAQDLLPKPGQKLDGEGQNSARDLARQQREVAAKLEESGDRDDSGRADEMAREARQIAQQLESANLDAAVLERQQRLFRKMLDAGRLLEEDEREDTGKREAKSWTGTEVHTPSGANASGKSASRYVPPTWNELRGLTPEERRLVLEYFKRINEKP